MAARRRVRTGRTDPGTRPLLTPDQARSLLAYNHAVFDRFVRKVRRLPDRAARKKREIGHQSLFDTLVHVLNVQEVWLLYIAQGRSSDAELEPLFKDASRHPGDWKGFATYHRRVHAATEAFVGNLTSRDMSRKVRAFWMPGSYTLSDGLLQATFEEAHHLGEIIGALWQDDLPSPPMTWIEVQRSLGAPARRRRS